jgi:hypothetical protein
MKNSTLGRRGVLVCMAMAFTACGGGSSPTTTIPPPAVAPPPAASTLAIASQPASTTVYAGEAATFSVSATGTGTLSYQWLRNGSAISGATAASYTTPPVSSADAAAQFTVVVTDSTGSLTSSAATLGVVARDSGADVLTYHADNMRTGSYSNESLLTPANVVTAKFGKVGLLATDGKVDAQPLIVGGVSFPGTVARDVAYVATEHDSVYAFDVPSGVTLWHAALAPTGETPSDTRGCDQVTPEIGVTATPVIDRTRGPNGVLYVIAMSKNNAGQYFQRLHALDLATGAELFGGPVTIQASAAGTGANTSAGRVMFDPAQYEVRSALLLLNGAIYTAWTSHCDINPYTGWIMAFDAATLAPTSVLNITPNGSGGGIWMAGGGLAADAANNVYLLDGNGTFDTTLDAGGFPSQGDFGNAFLKLSTSGGLAVADYFASSDTVSLSNQDLDLGSGATLLLPDLTDNAGQVRHLAVGAGKTGVIYVVNRDAMGKFDPATNHVVQEIHGALPGVFSGPAYFNNTVYYGAVGDRIKSFPIANARLATTQASQTSQSFVSPGATPSISSLGTGNAILWAVENAGTAVLHAYDATDLSKELYNSSQNSTGRDQFGAGNKFITPVIAYGRVYVGTPTGLAVFGLLP